MIRYGSVCSGIEAASLAWEPLGWQAAWFAEIEPFPSRVLAHRWPHVPNLGDMCVLPDYLRMGIIEAPDVLVGGTPCQAFSVAGLRQGLIDPRGLLTIKFVEVADAIDSQRPDDPCIVCWENVPGVLSDKGNAFGCFLGALVGEECALEHTGKRWPNAGAVYGPKRSAAWRVLDAQYFGVAQRRRRVFVVASARAGFDPAAVLFESEGVRRDTAPSREAGETVAGHAAGSVGTGSHWDHPSNPHPSLNQSHNIGGVGQSNHEAPIIVQSQYGSVAGALTARHDSSPCADRGMNIVYGFQPRIARNGHGDMGDVVHALTSQSVGASDAAPCVAVAFAENSRSEVRLEGGDGSRCGALSTGGGKAGQGTPCVAMYGIDNEQNICEASGVLGPLLKDSPTGGGRPLPAIAFNWNAQPDQINFSEHSTPALTCSQGAAVQMGWSVRRLTPRECERLQGMPDDHTAIPGAADGPRYKAIGNSKAVPVVRWLGRRLQAVLS